MPKAEAWKNKDDSWNTTLLAAEPDVLQAFTDLRGKRWLCRGQSRCYGGLVPSIDREPRQQLSRVQTLTLERRSIDLFRSTARFFADPGEQGALANDIVALMVLRHYGVPSRLLDWSWSPWWQRTLPPGTMMQKTARSGRSTSLSMNSRVRNSGRGGLRQRVTVPVIAPSSPPR